MANGYVWGKVLLFSESIIVLFGAKILLDWLEIANNHQLFSIKSKIVSGQAILMTFYPPYGSSQSDETTRLAVNRGIRAPCEDVFLYNMKRGAPGAPPLGPSADRFGVSAR